MFLRRALHLLSHGDSFGLFFWLLRQTRSLDGCWDGLVLTSWFWPYGPVMTPKSHFFTSRLPELRFRSSNACTYYLECLLWNLLLSFVDLCDISVPACVCVFVLSSILQGFSVCPSRRLGYVSPAPQATPKDLVVIYSCGSTWGDLFRPPRSFLSAASVTRRASCGPPASAYAHD